MKRVSDTWLRETAEFESNPAQRPMVGAALRELIDARALIAAQEAARGHYSERESRRAVAARKRYLERWGGDE